MARSVGDEASPPRTMPAASTDRHGRCVAVAPTAFFRHFLMRCSGLRIAVPGETFGALAGTGATVQGRLLTP